MDHEPEIVDVPTADAAFMEHVEHLAAVILAGQVNGLSVYANGAELEELVRKSVGLARMIVVVNRD